MTKMSEQSKEIEAMSYTEFVDKTVVQLNEVLFYELRDILVDEYIPFAVVKRKDITKEILAEI